MKKAALKVKVYKKKEKKVRLDVMLNLKRTSFFTFSRKKLNK